MYGMQSVKVPEGARTTWDLWQEEVQKNMRLSNALRIIGIDPVSVEQDQKYDNVDKSEVKNG